MHQAKRVCVLVAPLNWGLGHATRCIPIIKGLNEEGVRVLMAASGPQQSLLKQEFPGLECLEIPGYQIRYKSGFFLKWGLILKIPAILKQIRKERRWLHLCLENHPIDAVISDNRYGLYHNDLICVFLTHQLSIQSGFGRYQSSSLGIPPRAGITGFSGRWAEKRIRIWNYRLISKFSECWVPDREREFSAAGILAHPAIPAPVPVHYLGLLSRFRRGEETIRQNTLLILLSGPEPQRTDLEHILLEQLAGADVKTVLVRGLPSEKKAVPETEGVKVFNHLPTDRLNELILSAEYIISRSGYSTVMDLLILKRNAILIPTPGQTEQEYLGSYLHEKKWMFTISQKNFKLETALKEFKAAKLELPEVRDSPLRSVLRELIKKCLERNPAGVRREGTTISRWFLFRFQKK